MSTERAVLAGACFWGMQELIRKLPGAVSTRVGYSGGDVPNATTANHGSHAEAIEIIFDPEATSFRALLQFFFQNPRTDHAQPAGQRHRHELSLGDFYTSPEQKEVAEDTIADVEAGPSVGRALFL